MEVLSDSNAAHPLPVKLDGCIKFISADVIGLEPISVVDHRSYMSRETFNSTYCYCVFKASMGRDNLYLSKEAFVGNMFLSFTDLVPLFQARRSR
jgi:hypothetical protein